MVSIVEMLESRLLPEFEELANELNKLPDVQAKPFSYRAGSLTEFLAHVIGVDCLLSKPETEADNVALSVGVEYLTMCPRISAHVCWGHPSGHIDAEWGWSNREFSTELNIVTNEVLDDLYSNI